MGPRSMSEQIPVEVGVPIFNGEDVLRGPDQILVRDVRPDAFRFCELDLLGNGVPRRKYTG
ncbi:MAG: hypothetical protein MZV70_73045 [Desulfobacterales bacterium]|nr:hypothetical protein [Desulfobacterales bacterium]